MFVFKRTIYKNNCIANVNIDKYYVNLFKLFMPNYASYSKS